MKFLGGSVHIIPRVSSEVCGIPRILLRIHVYSRYVLRHRVFGKYWNYLDFHLWIFREKSTGGNLSNSNIFQIPCDATHSVNIHESLIKYVEFHILLN